MPVMLVHVKPEFYDLLMLTPVVNAKSYLHDFFDAGAGNCGNGVLGVLFLKLKSVSRNAHPAIVPVLPEPKRMFRNRLRVQSDVFG